MTIKNRRSISLNSHGKKQKLPVLKKLFRPKVYLKNTSKASAGAAIAGVEKATAVTPEFKIKIHHCVFYIVRGDLRPLSLLLRVPVLCVCVSTDKTKSEVYTHTVHNYRNVHNERAGFIVLAAVRGVQNSLTSFFL